MNRVEIRNYEGDGTDLAQLIGQAWAKAYRAKAWYPMWDASYFSWRLLAGCGRDRSFLCAAYQGSKLVGSLLAEPMDIRVKDQVVRGTLSSWLSVDPDAGSPDMAIRLLEGMRARHADHGMRLAIGVTSSDRRSPMRRFWDGVGRRRPEDTRFLGPVKFWARVFDGKAVAEAGLDTFERAAARLNAPIPYGWIGWRAPAGVRRYVEADLDRCLTYVRDQAAGADLAVEWTRERLRLQLDHPYVTTLVIDDGARGGFVNYYAIDYQSARQVRVGLIDLCAGTLGIARQIDLLKAACLQMKADGAHMSMMMMAAAAPGTSLLAAGFIPIPAHLDLFTIFPDPALDLRSPLRVHTLFT